jgi:hypothetical protein
MHQDISYRPFHFWWFSIKQPSCVNVSTRFVRFQDERSYHLLIQVEVMFLASSTNPISSINCTVPLTADSKAEEIQACV